MMEKSAEKRMVVPGEIVTDERKKLGAHVFIDNGKIVADCMGIVYEDSPVAQVVPLRGKYQPLEEDVVIGIVAQETFNGYLIDSGALANSFVSKEDVREKLVRGSVISARVTSVSEIGEIDLVEPRVYLGGDLIEVSPVKVPRIIGKQGSMLNVLKNGTGCNLVVGRNGRIWVKGGNTQLLRKAISYIESHSHESNLTQTLENLLKDPAFMHAGHN